MEWNMSDGTNARGGASGIEFATVDDLARSIERCKGHFSFMIGAGSSRKAGIPTASELIEDWRREQYEHENLIEDIDQVDSDEIENWASDVETEEMADHENSYGFWFEKSYVTSGERRQFIRDLVADAEPTFGHIVLASLMEKGYVPLTLTPNFDDLLYDAFYLFIEEKPMMIDHNAIAPQFQLTQERPTIIKLHGDYLYDNLKNTSTETEELESNMQMAVSRSLDEYGMVVVGYGGRDKSIMGVINSDDITIPDYGLFWCKFKNSELSPEAEKLLKKPNTFLVEIEGFEQFLTELYSRLDDVSVPMPSEIRSRAEDREQMLIEKVAETEGTGSLELIMSAEEYISDGNYDTAIDMLTRNIEGQSDSTTDVSIYDRRGRARLRNGEMEDGIEDYNKTIELDEDPGRYLNRAEAWILANEPENAVEDIDTARKTDGNVNEGVVLFLTIAANILSDEDFEQDWQELEELAQDGGIPRWEFDTFKECLEHMSVSDEKREKLEDLVDMVEFDRELKSHVVVNQ